MTEDDIDPNTEEAAHERWARDPLLSNLYRQFGELMVRKRVGRPTAAGESYLAVGDDPNRIALFVQDNTAGYKAVSYVPLSNPIPIPTDLRGPTPVVIHVASHPLLVAGSWWVGVGQDCVVHVWEVVRRVV